VGNAEQGKRITHRMYAAGHPPLGPFEIESHAERMPRHWRTLREKTDLSDEWRKQLEYDPERHERARSAIVGAAVTLAESLKLLAAEATEATRQENGSQPAWPELARYDCTACHHDLKIDESVRLSFETGRPGRPRLPRWSQALLRLQHADELDKTLKPVFDALSEQPFGQPAKLAPAAKQAADEIDELAERLAAPETNYRGAAVIELLSKAAVAGQSAPDADTARLLSGMIRIVYAELAQSGAASELLSDEQRTTIEQQLVQLDKQFSPLPAMDLSAKSSIAARLPAWLAAPRDPKAAQSAFRAIGRALQAPR
jgi:hypothetical protein